MRKISSDAAAALMSYKKFKRGNTQVTVDESGAAYLYLFGNMIACHEVSGELKITDAGYSTVTTKDRLNALPHVSIYQRKSVWYLNEEEWDGDWDIVYNPDPNGLQWGRKRIRSSDDSIEEVTA
tara:strand:+ start:295 stop:666 length:372 start_codon:yes stop_codon:yes gene_type:complete